MGKDEGGGYLGTPSILFGPGFAIRRTGLQGVQYFYIYIYIYIYI
jgi:hypothetical protein